MAVQKEVKVKVATDVDTSEVEALEAKIRQMKNQKIRADIEADTKELEDVDAKIKSLENFLSTELVGGVKLDASEVKKAQEELQALKSKQYDLKINVATNELQAAKNLEASLTSTQKVFVDADTGEVVSAQKLIKSLEGTEQVFVDADTGEVVSAKELIDSLNDTERVFVDVEDGEARSAKELIESLTSTQQVKIEVDDGEVRSLKDELAGFAMGAMGFSEAKEGIESMVDAAASADQNLAFLQIGFDKAGSKDALQDAKDAQRQIQEVVQHAPGDDIAMNSIISSAVAKDVSLADKDLRKFGDSVADYFAGAEVNGKHAAEAIQDVRSYITSGNVAELETTGIFNQEQLDQLKDIDTVSGRVEKFQEMMEESSYAGLSGAETLSNKFAELDGMIAKGQTDLGGLFAPAIKGCLDFANELNDITNGGFGMLLAAAQPVGGALVGVAGTLSDISVIDKNWNITENFSDVKGKVVDLANNIKDKLTDAFSTLKTNIHDVKDKVTEAFSTLKTKVLEVASSIKTTLLNAWSSFTTYMSSTVIPAVKNAVLALKEMALNVLEAGYNALKSAAMWAYQKLALVASTLAEYGLAAAQAILNAVMSMNPIMIVVIALAALAAALVWAYYNVDWFREMVDNAWKSIQEFGAYLMGTLTGAINWLSEAFNNAGQTIQSAIGSAVGWVMGALGNLWNYIMTLGGLIPANASITGNGVIDAALKVITFLATLPMQLSMILVNMIASALGFGDNFSQNLIQSAANAVGGFISWISMLPTRMQEELQMVVDTTVLLLTSLLESITEITLMVAEALAFPFVNIGLVVYESMMTIWDTINGILATTWAIILTFGQNLLTTVMTVVNGVITNLSRGIAYFASIPGLIAGYLNSVISKVVSWGSSIASNFLSAASKSVSNFASQISQIPAKLGSELSSALDKVNEWAATLPAKFWQAGVDAVKNFLSALGIASPGTMQRMLVWEITEMGKRIPEESRTLLSNVSDLGSNIVDEFGNPALKVNFDDTANAQITTLAGEIASENKQPQTINLTLEIGSVDNEDRINEIVEAVRRELAWNNKTAGRTV